jgi:hypothetical protein
MNDQTLITLITGIVALTSAFIGGALAIAGSFLKTWNDNRNERNRTLRAALFNQFELYNEAIRLSPKAHDRLSETLEKILGDAGAPEDARAAIARFRPQLASLMKEFLSTDIQALAERYDQIVEQVATVDSLLAGRISQRFYITRMSKLEAFFGPADFTAQPTGIEIFRTQMTSDHHRRFIHSVERSILETARRLGKGVFQKSRRQLKHVRRAFLHSGSSELGGSIAAFLGTLGKEMASDLQEHESE